ncbi:MAG: copper-binding protein [Lysobacteraceae bacterium]
MKLFALVFTATLLAGCSQAPSNPVDTSAAPAAAAPMSGATTAMPEEAAATKASASGTVKSVDASAGKITISHGPVESLKWPAMTMGFKATPAQVASVQVGQKVEFEFESRGMDGTITQITPQK